MEPLMGGQCSKTAAPKAKQRKFTTGVAPNGTCHLGTGSSTPAHSNWGLSVEAQASGVGPQGEGPGQLPGRYSGGWHCTAEADRGSSASTTETKDCSHGKAPTLPFDSAPSQKEGPCPGRCQRRASWLWSVVPEASRQAQRQRLKARAVYGLSPRGRNDHHAVSSCELPPTSCWVPEWLGSAKGPTTQDRLPWGSVCPPQTGETPCAAPPQ